MSKAKRGWPSGMRVEWEKPESEASLAYAFLLHRLSPLYEPLRHWLLHHFCHRTGWHLRRVRAPLYRLRSAQRPLVATLPALLCGPGQTTSKASSGDHHLTLVSGWSRPGPLCPPRSGPEAQNHLRLYDFREQLREAVCCQPPSVGLPDPLCSFLAPRLAPSLTASGCCSPILMRSRGNPPHCGGLPLLFLSPKLILYKIRDDSWPCEAECH